MRVLLFGTGEYYEKYSGPVYESEEVAALLDNDPDKWGKQKDSVMIRKPADALEMEFDKIILLSAGDMDMHRQLTDLGVPESKLWYLEQYYREKRFPVSSFPACGEPPDGRRKLLIVTTDLDYNGGTLAAVYMANALMRSGNSVIIAAPRGAADFVREHRAEGLHMFFYPGLPLMNHDFLSWAGQFDIVVVNVFQMLPCACEISKWKPVLWWLHEPGDEYCDIYRRTLYKYRTLLCRETFSRMAICAVSSQAKQNFIRYFPEAAVEVLPCGIPDRGQHTMAERSSHIVFAVAGSAVRCKGWDIFVEAVGRLGADERKKAEFWMIGAIGSNSFGEDIKRMASGEPSIKLMGELTRTQMERAYGEINVVVCCSREETLSLVVIEGLMHRKACIVSDGAGISGFLENGKNALICNAGDSGELASAMAWCISHRQELEKISENGRSVYEKHFTMDCFGERLEKAVEKAAALHTV